MTHKARQREISHSHLLILIVVCFVLGLFLGRSAAFFNGAHFLSPSAQTARHYSTWSEDVSPDYVLTRGPAHIDGVIPTKGSIIYSELDGYGRAGRAVGTITYEMMKEGLARKRDEMSSLNPSGWTDNRRVEIELSHNRSYHGYFWNRSHLIAKSLGGADRIENIITGTRTQNVGANDGLGGMAYAEGLARSYLENNPDKSLYYSACPVYEGDELVARSVVVDMRSEDGTLDVQIEIFNCAKGFSINYQTGEFSAQDD